MRICTGFPATPAGFFNFLKLPNVQTLTVWVTCSLQHSAAKVLSSFHTYIHAFPLSLINCCSGKGQREPPPPPLLLAQPEQREEAEEQRQRQTQQRPAWGQQRAQTQAQVGVCVHATRRERTSNLPPKFSRPLAPGRPVGPRLNNVIEPLLSETATTRRPCVQIKRLSRPSAQR